MEEIAIDSILPAFQFDKKAKTPRYQQLGAFIRSRAESGEFKPHQKLPPIRKLAEALGVNAVTVVNAYKALETGGAVYSTVGSGTYIADNKPVPAPDAAVFLDGRQRTDPDQYENIEAMINFARGAVPAKFFPADIFKRMINRVLETDQSDAFGYGELQGYEPLRRSFCDYVKRIGIDAVADNIHVVSGVRQGVDILSKTLLAPGDTVLVESPAAFGAAGAFLLRGANVLPVPLEPDGLAMEKLTALIKTYRPKLLYITPYFQTPTGVCYAEEKKKELLSLAEEHDFYLIEEDTQSEFSFAAVVRPVKAMDDKNKVIYIKGFSKTLMPGLRLGFMILPEGALSKVRSAKHVTDVETSGLTQRAFDLFLQSGAWVEHVSAMREAYRARYQKMAAACDRYLKGKLTYATPSGGLHFWLGLPTGVRSDVFCNRLITSGVVACPGSVFSPDGGDLPFIRLSCSDVSEGEIEEGVRRLGEIL